MNVIILDLETTGLRADAGDEIIDVAAVRVGPNGIEGRYASKVKPEQKDISPFIERLTHISSEDVKDAPSVSQVLSELKSFIGTNAVIVGQNVQFDIKFLHVFGLDLTDRPIVDTNDFATVLIPEAHSHSLEVLASMLDIEHEEKHTAMGDVLATFELLCYLKTLALDQGLFPLSPQLEQLRRQSPQYGGWNLVDMPLPASGRTLRQVGTSLKPSEIKPFVSEQEGGMSSLIMALEEQPDLTVVATVPTIKAYTSQGLKSNAFIFDSPYHIMVTEEIQNLIAKDSYETEAEALLALRLSFRPQQKPFFHIEEHSFSYKERAIIKQYSLAHLEQYHEAFTSFLALEDQVITTYGLLFYSEYSATLQARSHVHCLDSAMLPIDLIRHTTKKVSYDYISRAFEDVLAGSLPTEIEDDLYAMNHMIKFFFEYAESQLQQEKQQDLEFDDPRLRDFMLQLSKAVEQIQNSMIEQELTMHHALGHLLRIVGRLQEMFTEQDGYWLYLNKGYAGPEIILEKKSIEEELSYLKQGRISHHDTIPLASYPYVVHPDPAAMFTFGTNISVPTQEEVSALETDLAAAAVKYIAHDKKTIVLGQNGAMMEQLFDILTETLPSQMTLGLYGKSGGKAKINHNFAESQAGVLMYRWNLVSELTTVACDELHILQMPFTIVEGRKVTEMYGYKTFFAITMPLVKKQLADLMERLARYNNGVLPQVKLLDPRFVTKSYGQELVRFFEE